MTEKYYRLIVEFVVRYPADHDKVLDIVKNAVKPIEQQRMMDVNSTDIYEIFPK